MVVKLKQTKVALKNWNREVFSGVDIIIKELKKRLTKLEDILQIDHNREMKKARVPNNKSGIRLLRK